MMKYKRAYRIRFILISLLYIATYHTSYAQAKQAVFVEVLGSSTGLGLHYDLRLSENTNWGVRLGVAHIRTDSQDFFNSSPDRTSGWSFPMALSYLWGKELLLSDKTS